MKLEFVNVGYGEAIIVRQGAYTLVIDGGPNRAEVYETPGTLRLADALAHEQVEQIDLMIVTHIHEDHIAGLIPVLERFPVREIWCNVLPEGDVDALLARVQPLVETLSDRLYTAALRSYSALRRLAAEKQIPLREMHGDGRLRKLGGLEVTLFGLGRHETEAYRGAMEAMLREQQPVRAIERLRQCDAVCNRTSLAMRVSDGRFTALLTGDKVEGWPHLKQTHELAADVLKVTHHGQRNGMDQAMLEGADPQVIVICADADRTFNSAHPTVIGRAQQYLSERKRFPKIFITGRLQQGNQFANVLEVTKSEKEGCTKETLKLYE